ncbi:MAG: hypothetical protein ABSC17_07905 [Thermacetogeniaceae bacterium]
MQLWGRGEQTRCGSMQYTVLSPELCQQADQRIREAGWVTGGSSPWVGPITVQEEKKLSETATEFTVIFPEITSAPPNPTATERFVVEQFTVNGKRAGSSRRCCSPAVMGSSSRAGRGKALQIIIGEVGD